MSRHNYFLSFSLLLLTFALTGCGGGGGGSPTGNGADNNASSPESGSGTLSNPAVLNIETLYDSSVALGGAVYYKFNTATRDLYYQVDLQNISDRLNWTLYSDASYSSYVSSCSQSTDTSDCDTTNALNAGTTYYLKLQNLSTTSTDAYTIRLDRLVASEGDYSTPVQLLVNTPFEGTLGPNYSLAAKSYYKFTTSAADSTYTISLTGASTDVRWKLFSGGWNDGVRDCDDTWAAGDESCATVSLTGNTEYYLATESQGPDSTFVTINITEGGSHVDTLVDEGSVSTPATLVLEQAQTGTLSPNGTSYYKFTTGSLIAGHYFEMKHVSAALYLKIYSDSDFTNQVDAYSNHAPSGSFMNVGWRTILLDPTTTYYFKLENVAPREDQFQIGIYQDALQDPNSEGTLITPIVLTPGSLHSGSVGGNYGNSVYEFTLPEAKPYLISLTNTQTDLGWYVYNNVNDLFSHATCNEVFGTGDESCSMRRVDAGRTMYMFVSNQDDTSPSTFDLLVSVIEGEGEGTQVTPVSITPGTPYVSSVAVSTKSHYQFTTGTERAVHRITVTGADTNWSLIKVGNFSGSGCSTVTCDSNLLLANTAYRLEVSNNETASAAITVLVDTGTPIKDITLDVPLTAQNFDIYSKNDGYYKFTTNGVDTSYTLQATGSTNDVLLFVYPNDNYGTYITSTPCDYPAIGSKNISCTLNGLTINTTYYLRSYVSKNTGTSDSFDLAVLADSFSESGVSLTLGADYTGKVPSGGSSYYEFTTAGGGPRRHDFTYTALSGAYVRLYDDALYSNVIDSCVALLVSGSCSFSTTNTLSAGTTYYVAIEESGGYGYPEGYSGNFTLNIISQ